MVRLKVFNTFPIDMKSSFVSIPYGTIKSQSMSANSMSIDVSIPYGTIKSPNVARVAITQSSVSIPYGTIKRKFSLSS